MELYKNIKKSIKIDNSLQDEDRSGDEDLFLVLDKLSGVLGPNHSIFLERKIRCFLSNASDEIDKISLGRDILSVADILEPGYSFVRGMFCQKMPFILILVLKYFFRKNIVATCNLFARKHWNAAHADYGRSK